jgi:hypothetical protein
MKMVVQKAITEKLNSKLSHHVCQELEESLPISVVKEDGSLLDTPVEDVVKGSLDKGSLGSWHGIHKLQ